jgi:hypothetical protein
LIALQHELAVCGHGFDGATTIEFLLEVLCERCDLGLCEVGVGAQAGDDYDGLAAAALPPVSLLKRRTCWRADQLASLRVASGSNR